MGAIPGKLPPGHVDSPAARPRVRRPARKASGLFAGLDRVTLAKLAAPSSRSPSSGRGRSVSAGRPGRCLLPGVRGSFGIFVAGTATNREAREHARGPGPRSARWLCSAVTRVRRPFAPTTTPSVATRSRAFLGLGAVSPGRARRRGRALRASARAGCARVDPPAAAMAHHAGRRGAAVDGPPGPAAAQIRDGAWRRARRTPAAAILLIAILAVTWLAPPAGIYAAGWRALGTLVAAVPLLALDALPRRHPRPAARGGLGAGRVAPSASR